MWAALQQALCRRQPTGVLLTRRVRLLGGALRFAAQMFGTLPAETQKRVADAMERSPGEILKKLEDLRSRIT